MRTQLSAILDAVAELSHVDTSAVEPTSHAAGEVAQRPDEGAPVVPSGKGTGERPGGWAPASRCRASSSDTDGTDRPVHARAGRKLGSGELSSVEAVRACLARVDRLDGRVKAFLRVDREGALAQAEAADRRRTKGKRAGPLDGVPVGLKDLFLTEGLPTTAGSRSLESFVAPYDGTAVKPLRAAGTPILGKLNMDEFAMGSSTENSAFFPTRNPWNLETSPGGSSAARRRRSRRGWCSARWARIPADRSGSRRPSPERWASSRPTGACRASGWWPSPARWTRSAR